MISTAILNHTRASLLSLLVISSMVVITSTTLLQQENRFTRLVYATSPNSFAINCGYSTTSVAITAWSFTPNAVYTIEFFEFLNKSPNSTDYKTSSTTQQANNPTPGYLSATFSVVSKSDMYLAAIFNGSDTTKYPVAQGALSCRTGTAAQDNTNLQQECLAVYNQHKALKGINLDKKDCGHIIKETAK
jgi:hypothetical protein